MDILVLVDGQRMHMEADLKRVAFGSQNFVKFDFALNSDDWGNVTDIRALFIRGSSLQSVTLVAESSQNSAIAGYDWYYAYLPQNLAVGVWMMTLRGVNNSSVIATSNGIKLTIVSNGLESETISGEIETMTALEIALDAEAWAVGKRSGAAVSSGDETYHNNSKYYAGLAQTYASNASTSASRAAASESGAAHYYDLLVVATVSETRSCLGIA